MSSKLGELAPQLPVRGLPALPQRAALPSRPQRRRVLHQGHAPQQLSLDLRAPQSGLADDDTPTPAGAPLLRNT